MCFIEAPCLEKPQQEKNSINWWALVKDFCEREWRDELQVHLIPNDICQCKPSITVFDNLILKAVLETSRLKWKCFHTIIVLFFGIQLAEEQQSLINCQLFAVIIEQWISWMDLDKRTGLHFPFHWRGWFHYCGCNHYTKKVIIHYREKIENTPHKTKIPLCHRWKKNPVDVAE